LTLTGTALGATSVAASTAFFGRINGSNVINVSTITSANIYATGIPSGIAWPVCVDINGNFYSTPQLTINSNNNLSNVGTLACGNITLNAGASKIGCTDTSRGFLEFLGTNSVRITAGGTSPGTATLNNGGDLNVTGEVITSTTRMNGTSNRQGHAFVTATNRLVAQNQASASSFGTGNYAFLAIDGTTWTASSDRRLKYDIQPFENCLDKVLALNPVTYKWISTGRPALGFIAQEVKEIMPELVDAPEDPEEMMGIEITNMTAFLVKAIQEQNKMIKSLEEKIINMR
jgi:hypothetical protein